MTPIDDVEPVVRLNRIHDRMEIEPMASLFPVIYYFLQYSNNFLRF